MSDKKALAILTRHSLNRGKSRLGLAIDRIALYLGVLAVSYIILFFRTFRIISSALGALAILAGFILVHLAFRAIRLRAREETLVQDLEREGLLARFRLLQEADFFRQALPWLKSAAQIDGLCNQAGAAMGTLGKNTVFLHLAATLPGQKATPEACAQAFHAYRRSGASHGYMIGLDGFALSSEQIEFLSASGIGLLNGKDFAAYLQKQGQTLTDEEWDKLLALKVAALRRHPDRGEFFLPIHAKRYLTSAIVLLALSLMTRYGIYYMVIAGVCVVLAAVCTFNGRQGDPGRSAN